MFIRIFIVKIANLILVCLCNKIDEQIVGYRIKIERSETEKYEFIHESCVFFITFFSNQII